MDQQKLNYYLISGKILFRLPEDKEEVAYSRDANGIITVDSPNFTTKELARMQQTLQVNFHNSIGNNKVVVIDVVITGLFSLGSSTREEFEKHVREMQALKETEQAPKQ